MLLNLNFSGTAATESDIFTNATNQTSKDHEKQKIRNKLLLAKTRAVRRSRWLEGAELMHSGKTNAYV